MKKLFLLFTIALITGCSKDDMSNCNEIISEINTKIDSQIDWVKENTNPIDYERISLLNEERNIKISKACN